jgi:hypothetical protein
MKYADATVSNGETEVRGIELDLNAATVGHRMIDRIVEHLGERVVHDRLNIIG